MGFIRKATFIGTGGVSGLFIKANSKKERTAKATEKQLRLQKQQLEIEKSLLQQSTRTSSQAMEGQPPISPGFTLTTELERLADLHRNGDLSDDEFEVAKKRLVGSIRLAGPGVVGATNAPPAACAVGPCSEPRSPGSSYCSKHGPKVRGRLRR